MAPCQSATWPSEALPAGHARDAGGAVELLVEEKRQLANREGRWVGGRKGVCRFLGDKAGLRQGGGAEAAGGDKVFPENNCDSEGVPGL